MKNIGLRYDEEEGREEIEFINHLDGYMPLLDFETCEYVPGCYMKIRCPAMS